MRYAYNETDGLINGVIFFFEKGDAEIAIETFKIINSSEQKPTSIVWNGISLTSSEVLSKLREPKTLNNKGYLGVRFTVEESRLLKECLTFFKKNYPALLPIIKGIDSQVFGVIN